jgi:hypothetical protein
MRATIKYIAPWVGRCRCGRDGLAPVAGGAPVSSSVSNTQVGAPGARSPQPAPTPTPVERIHWCPPMWVLIPRCRSFPAWGGPSDTSCVAPRASRTVEWDHNS